VLRRAAAVKALASALIEKQVLDGAEVAAIVKRNIEDAAAKASS
jgi:hypothetical protein